MKLGKQIIAATLATAIVLSVTACNKEEDGKEQAQTQGSESIKIAVVGPLTGDNAEYGLGFVQAAEMKAEEFNKSGGVLGKKIVIEKFDDKNSPEEGVSVANKIVSAKDIKAVIGHFASGVCMAAAPLYNENKILEISPSASHPDYSSIGEYIIRNNTIINKEAAASIDIAVDKFNKKKVGIISIKTDWGVSTAAIVKQLIDKRQDGAKVVAHEEVIEGSDDYRPAITKLKEAGTEVVIAVGMYNLLAPVAKQYKEVDPDIKLVGFSNAYSQYLLELGGKSVEGVAFPVIFFSKSNEEKIKTFVHDFKEKYGNEPSALTAQAYDSVGVYLQAVAKVGSQDPEKVKNAVLELEYEGVTGHTKFDKNGDVEKAFTYVVIENGQFGLLK